MVGELAELIREGRARFIGLIRQELLSGMKTVDQYEKLRASLRPFPDETVETSDYESAAKHRNQWRPAGNGPSSQLIPISKTTRAFLRSSCGPALNEARALTAAPPGRLPSVRSAL